MFRAWTRTNREKKKQDMLSLDSNANENVDGSLEDLPVPQDSRSDANRMIRLVESEVLVGVQGADVWCYSPFPPRAIAVGPSPSLRWTGTTAGGPVRRKGVPVAGKPKTGHKDTGMKNMMA